MAPNKTKPARNTEFRIAVLRIAKNTIANSMRFLCSERVLDFDVMCVDTVGVEAELAGFTVELLRAELSN